jgi:hypothetical protein
MEARWPLAASAAGSYVDPDAGTPVAPPDGRVRRALNQPEMRRYADTMTLSAARTAFFKDAGLGANGGYDAWWVRVEAKPFPVFFPNTRGRVAAAKLHDLHHIATEYAADWPGEAEIAAWEIASGCGPYGWAWILNVGAFAVGLLLAPRRIFRAFVRGRRERNLYHEPLADSELGAVTVGMLRQRLGVHGQDVSARPADVAAFLAWCGIAAAYLAAVLALVATIAWSVWVGLGR